jgi:hypothetical protein
VKNEKANMIDIVSSKGQVPIDLQYTTMPLDIIKTENKYGCNRTISDFWGKIFCFLTSKFLILSG